MLPASSTLRCGCRDLILHPEHIRHLAVVAFRPEMISVGGVDKLRRHPNPAPGTPYAAFKDRTDAECFGDLADVLLLAPEREGRSTRRHLQGAAFGNCVSMGSPRFPKLSSLQDGDWEPGLRSWRALSPNDGALGTNLTAFKRAAGGPDQIPI